MKTKLFMDSDLDLLISSRNKLFPQKNYFLLYAPTGSVTFSKKIGGILAKTEQYSLSIKKKGDTYILC